MESAIQNTIKIGKVTVGLVDELKAPITGPDVLAGSQPLIGQEPVWLGIRLCVFHVFRRDVLVLPERLGFATKPCSAPSD